MVSLAARSLRGHLLLQLRLRLRDLVRARRRLDRLRGDAAAVVVVAVGVVGLLRVRDRLVQVLAEKRWWGNKT